MTHPRRVRQAGFTLIELMLAATLGLMLMLVIGATLSDTLRSADAVNSQIAVNRHAREIFDMLAFGGHVEDANTNATASTADGPIALDFNHVFGLRGRSTTGVGGTTPWSMPAEATGFMVMDSDGVTRRYRFALSANGEAPNDGTTPDYRLLAEEVRDATALCVDYNLPLQGCALAGDTVTPVRGFLRADPQFEAPSIANNVAEIGFQLTEPSRLNAPRSLSTGTIVPFWSAFTALQGTNPW